MRHLKALKQIELVIMILCNADELCLFNYITDSAEGLWEAE
jgi:hypothetical protein